MSDDDELVRVYSTNRQEDVALAKMWLDSEGIDYVAENDMFSVLYPVGSLGTVKFRVRRRDAERAIEVLRTHGHK